MKRRLSNSFQKCVWFFAWTPEGARSHPRPGTRPRGLPPGCVWGLGLVLVLGLGSSAQAQRYLGVDVGKKRVYFKAGESLRMRLLGEEDYTLRRLSAIRDTALILDDKMAFLPSQIQAIQLPSRKQRFRILKSLSLYAGIGLPVLSAANGLIFGHRPLLTPWSLAAGGVLLTTYGVLMAATHIPRHIRNSGGTRFKILVLEP